MKRLVAVTLVGSFVASVLRERADRLVEKLNQESGPADPTDLARQFDEFVRKFQDLIDQAQAMLDRTLPANVGGQDSSTGA